MRLGTFSAVTYTLHRVDDDTSNIEFSYFHVRWTRHTWLHVSFASHRLHYHFVKSFTWSQSIAPSNRVSKETEKLQEFAVGGRLLIKRHLRGFSSKYQLFVSCSKINLWSPRFFKSTLANFLDTDKRSLQHWGELSWHHRLPPASTRRHSNF